jgi:hypothetical protein
LTERVTGPRHPRTTRRRRPWRRIAPERGRPRPVADERAVGSGPQRQRQADGHHGLAGARLRKDVQAGMELEVGSSMTRDR